MAQITCRNLTLGYDNRAIQEDLNFSIGAGDYLCIVEKTDLVNQH